MIMKMVVSPWFLPFLIGLSFQISIDGECFNISCSSLAPTKCVDTQNADKTLKLNSIYC